MSFQPRFTITDAVAAALTRIERARGFLEAATLSEQWVRQMGASDIRWASGQRDNQAVTSYDKLL